MKKKGMFIEGLATAQAIFKEDFEEVTIKTIIKVASTGEVGDGKIL